jgi:DNA-binding IclR family transcriptional regulator
MTVDPDDDAVPAPGAAGDHDAATYRDTAPEPDGPPGDEPDGPYDEPSDEAPDEPRDDVPDDALGAPRERLLGSVRTAARALRAFGHADAELGVTELARKLGIGKSTAHRVLATLAAERLLEHDPVTGRYRLGLALYELGTSVSEHVDLHQAALPVLTTLRHSTGEMVHVAVLDGLEVVYVERLESHHMLPIFRRVGHRLPAHVTSSGKALLAALPRADLMGRLAGVTLDPRTPKTITDPQALLADLDRTARRGWAVNLEEGQLGVISVGAPIRDADGRAIAAISVVGAAGRMRGATMSRCTALVTESAAVISARLGHRPTRRTPHPPP